MSVQNQTMALPSLAPNNPIAGKRIVTSCLNGGAHVKGCEGALGRSIGEVPWLVREVMDDDFTAAWLVELGKAAESV